MRHNFKKNIMVFFILVLIIGLSMGYIRIRNVSDNMSNLPKGDFLCESTSPNGKYMIKTYLCNGGATVDYAVRGQLINTQNKKIRNIYWEYKISTSQITWSSDDTVIINGHKIVLPNGKYDWRVDS